MVSSGDITNLANQIAERFKPDRIYLFGSYAYGEPNENCDVDLLVLKRGTQVHDLAMKIRREMNFGFAVDLLVRTPKEFESRIAMEDFFLTEIKTKGKILYGASDQGMGGKSRRGLRVRPARASRSKIA